MSNKPSVIDRLYSCLTDYEQTANNLAFKLSDLAQDISFVKEELQYLIDQEKYYKEG